MVNSSIDFYVTLYLLLSLGANGLVEKRVSQLTFTENSASASVSGVCQSVEVQHQQQDLLLTLHQTKENCHLLASRAQYRSRPTIRT